MDKKQIAGIVVVLVSLLFITEQLYFGGPLNFGPGGGSGSNVTGTTEFSGTIRTYDPILVVPLNTSSSVIEETRGRDDVKNIRTDAQGYIIDADTRDDVFVIGSFLRSRNVSSVSVANIAVTRSLEVQTISGKMNASVPGGIIRLVMEPIFDTGSEVRVSMTAVVSNNVLVDYYSAGLQLEQITELMDATVLSLDRQAFTYVIPWESRNNITPEGNYSYRKVDSIVFAEPLDLSQIIAKKQFPYITYIDSGSAQVLPDFDDKAAVALNFQDVNYTLPPSVLVTDTPLNESLGYNATVRYLYSVALNRTGLEPSVGAVQVETPSALELNSSIQLNVTVLEMGGKVISVKRAALPS